MPIPLSDPAAVDALLSQVESPADLGDLPAGDDLHAVRYAHIALVLGRGDLLAAGLNALDGITAPPARGVRMLLQAQLGDYAAVLADDGHPHGCAPLQLEDAAHANAALAVAHTQCGDFEQAAQHLSVAIALGQALGLRNRVSIMQIERERLWTLRGVARPEELQRLLVQPMSERRRSWGQRTWAESLMSLGDYPGALRALGHPSLDQPSDVSLRAFLHVLLSLPPLELPESDTSGYARLARVGANPDAPPTDLYGIEGEPQATYAALRASLMLAGAPETVEQAVRIIGERPPARADQAFYHAYLWLTALALGARHPQPSVVLDHLEQAALKLRTPVHAMAVSQRLLPLTATLLGLSDLAPLLGSRLVELPLLVGQDVLWKGVRHRLPGRTGRVLLAEALGLPGPALARSERSRLAARLRELGVPTPVNLGAVLAAAERLRQLAQDAARPAQVEFWCRVGERALAMLPSSAELPGAHELYPQFARERLG